MDRMALKPGCKQAWFQNLSQAYSSAPEIVAKKTVAQARKILSTKTRLRLVLICYGFAS
jgi:hypothetical protein